MSPCQPQMHQFLILAPGQTEKHQPNITAKAVMQNIYFHQIRVMPELFRSLSLTLTALSNMMHTKPQARKAFPTWSKDSVLNNNIHIYTFHAHENIT